jgi:hypothetical protein
MNFTEDLRVEKGDNRMSRNKVRKLIEGLKAGNGYQCACCAPSIVSLICDLLEKDVDQQPGKMQEQAMIQLLLKQAVQAIMGGNVQEWLKVKKIFFLDFPIYLQSVEIHSNTISKLCVGKRGRVEDCSVAPFCDKRVKTLCGCRRKSVQTKEKYKLRLTIKAYKLSYNCINYTLNLVGRLFD